MEMRMDWPKMAEDKQAELQLMIETLRGLIPCDMVILYGQYASGKMRSKHGGYELLVVTNGTPAMLGWELEKKLRKIYPNEQRKESRLHIETACISDINRLNTSSWFYLNIRNEGIILYNDENKESQNIFTRNGFKSTRAYQTARRNFDYYFNTGSGFLASAEHAWSENQPVVAAFQLSYAAIFLIWTIEKIFYGNRVPSRYIITNFYRARHFSKALLVEFNLGDKGNQKFIYGIDAMREAVCNEPSFMLSPKAYKFYCRRIKTLQEIARKCGEAHLEYLEQCKLAAATGKLSRSNENIVIGKWHVIVGILKKMRVVFKQ